MKIGGVEIPGEGYCFVAPGTEVINERIIAGKRSDTVFRAASRMAQLYGGRPERWRKMRGEVLLMIDDEYRRAEIHWAEESSVGEFQIKFIGWLW